MIPDFAERVSLPTEAVVDVINCLIDGDKSERDAHASALLAMLIYNEGVEEEETVISLTEDIMHMRDAISRREEISQEDIDDIEGRLQESRGGGEQ